MELCTKTTDTQGYKHRVFAWPRGWRMAFTGKGKRVLPVGVRVWIYSLLLLLLVLPTIAALPPSLTLSGAGTTAANGNYAPYSGSTNSYTQYTNGTYYVVYVSGPGGSAWEVSNTPNANYMNTFQYTNTGGNSTTFPLTGWTVNGGVAPAPTFSAGPPPALPTVSSVLPSPTSLAGSGTIVLTVTLSAAAPSGGSLVTITYQNNGTAGIGLQPTGTQTLTVPAGSTSAQFTETITYQAGTGTSPEVFTATYNSSSAACQVTIGTASGGTGTTTTAAGAPGVSASLTPYVIAPGGSSVLRWDTSGASTVTVTGVAAPSMAGTVNVAPTASATYTVSATNSAGTTTQTVTLTVGGPNAPGGDGISSFTGGNFAPTINLGGFTAPTLPAIPGLTLPNITLPTFTIPGMTTPSLPGDLKIGIPGLGSIGIPTNWLTQILTYASMAASVGTGMTGAVLTSGMQYAAYTTNLAVAGVDVDLKNNTATLHGDAVTMGQTIHNEQTLASQINYDMQAKTQGIISSTAANTQSVISASALSTQNVITTTEAKSVVDFKGMLSDLLSYLFIPDPSVLDQFKAEQAQFINWGPYSFITSFKTLLAAPAGDGKVGGVMLGVPALDVNADASTSYTIDPNTGQISGGQPGFSWYVNPNAAPIPFDFKQVTDLPGWAFVRLLLGAGVWVLFVTGVMRVVQPKQVL